MENENKQLKKYSLWCEALTFPAAGAVDEAVALEPLRALALERLRPRLCRWELGAVGSGITAATPRYPPVQLQRAEQQ